jgi:short-subunit dehydrogenase
MTEVPDSGTYLIVGGSSGLGRALAERFARSGHALVLVSSDQRDTEALAADLALRYEAKVATVSLDLADPTVDFRDIDFALCKLPPLAGVLLPAGMNRGDDYPGQSQKAFDDVTTANYTSLCRVINYYLPRLRAGSAGLIVGFGSVAATRGRTRNAAYSAAKRALQTYFESLSHACSASSIQIQFYVLGYLDTNLAFDQRTLLPKASPAVLADAIYQRRSISERVKYFPGFWYPLCMLVRAMPWFLFRRLSF